MTGCKLQKTSELTTIVDYQVEFILENECVVNVGWMMLQYRCDWVLRLLDDASLTNDVVVWLHLLLISFNSCCIACDFSKYWIPYYLFICFVHKNTFINAQNSKPYLCSQIPKTSIICVTKLISQRHFAIFTLTKLYTW